MQSSAVQTAMIYEIPLQVRSTFTDRSGTKIFSKNNLDYTKAVTGVAYSKDEAKITLQDVEDKPGIAAEIFEPLGKNQINIDMVIQNVSSDGKTTDITFRNFMEGLESSRAGVDKAFLKGLPIQGTEDYKAKSLTDPNFVTSFRRDLGTDFATWFSGQTREGKSYSSAPAKWIKDRFEAAGGWKDIDNCLILSCKFLSSKKLSKMSISDPSQLQNNTSIRLTLFSFKTFCKVIHSTL